MTTQTEAPVLSERIEVRFTPDDTSLAVRWRGQVWPVVAEPAHWFSRWNWWEQMYLIPAGPGHGTVIEVEYWRVQVQATSTLLRESTNRLQEIDAALQRIEAGSYGFCAVCGEAIPEGRLEIRPWTQYCVRHA